VTELIRLNEKNPMQKRVVVFAITLPFVVVSLVATSLIGQEKRIKKSDLPAAVQKAADEQSKGATIKGYNKEIENGKVEYEVELVVNSHSRNVSMDPQGNVLEVEEEVSLDSLPKAVREGLKQNAGKGIIRKIESIAKHGTLVAYEAHIMTAGKRSEIQVGPDGKTLEHEE